MIDDKKVNCILIGEYAICIGKDNFFIVQEGGEGGAFDKKEFEKVVKAFYDENF